MMRKNEKVSYLSPRHQTKKMSFSGDSYELVLIMYRSCQNTNRTSFECAAKSEKPSCMKVLIFSFFVSNFNENSFDGAKHVWLMNCGLLSLLFPFQSIPVKSSDFKKITEFNISPSDVVQTTYRLLGWNQQGNKI